MSKGTDWEATFAADEKGIERLALVFCDRADICSVMGWPAVASVQRQVRSGREIADIVLVRDDGSVALLEVKRAGLLLRDYCTGIGQLFHQAIMAVSVYQTTDVRLVLTLPGPVPTDVILACTMAGVDILPLPAPCHFVDEFRAVAPATQRENYNGA